MSFVSYHVFERNDTHCGIHVRQWAASQTPKTVLGASEPFQLQVGWTYLGTRTFPDQGSSNANKAYLQTLLTHERGQATMNLLGTGIVVGLCLGGLLLGAYLLGTKERPSAVVKSLMEEAKFSLRAFSSGIASVKPTPD